MNCRLKQPPPRCSALRAGPRWQRGGRGRGRPALPGADGAPAGGRRASPGGSVQDAGLGGQAGWRRGRGRAAGKSGAGLLNSGAVGWLWHRAWLQPVSGCCAVRLVHISRPCKPAAFVGPLAPAGPAAAGRRGPLPAHQRHHGAAQGATGTRCRACPASLLAACACLPACWLLAGGCAAALPRQLAGLSCHQPQRPPTRSALPPHAVCRACR